MSALLDGGDRLVDLERFSNRESNLRAIVVCRFILTRLTQTVKRGGNIIGMIAMLLPTTDTVTKKMQLRSGDFKGLGAPYFMVVIVVLTLRALAIAMPPLRPRRFHPKLKGVTK
jgi:hypothetical protein